MSSLSHQVPLVSFVFFIIIPNVFSLECWDCKSSINPACGDPFMSHPFAKMNCTANPKAAELKMRFPNATVELCRKVVEKVDGNIHVIRSCGYLDEPKYINVDRCHSSSKGLGVTINHCSCYSDGCNFGVNLRPNIFFIVLSYLAALSVYNFRNSFAK